METSEARRGRPWRWIAAGVVIVVVAGLAVFQPWKLVVDNRVDEALPVATGAPPTTAASASTGSPGTGVDTEATTPAPTEPAGPVTVSTGAFQAHAHPTTGQALVVEVDGKTYVRFEGLETDNGPDLVVYLAKQAPDAQAVGDDYLDLGVLKGNVGNQNYEVPAGVDLSEYSSVVIWCRRFAVSFGAAPVTVS